MRARRRKVEVYSALPMRGLFERPPWWRRVLFALAFGLAGVGYRWE